MQAAEKADVLAEWAERFGGFSELELGAFDGGKPAPLVDAVSLFRQRHSVGGVQRAKPPRRLLDHFFSHRLQQRKNQRSAGDALEYGTTVEFERCVHGRIWEVGGEEGNTPTRSVSEDRIRLLAHASSSYLFGDNAAATKHTNPKRERGPNQASRSRFEFVFIRRERRRYFSRNSLLCTTQRIISRIRY